MVESTTYEEYAQEQEKNEAPAQNNNGKVPVAEELQQEPQPPEQNDVRVYANIDANLLNKNVQVHVDMVRKAMDAPENQFLNHDLTVEFAVRTHFSFEDDPRTQAPTITLCEITCGEIQLGFGRSVMNPKDAMSFNTAVGQKYALQRALKDMRKRHPRFMSQIIGGVYFNTKPHTIVLKGSASK